jgi:hypothetical protein
VPFLNRQPCRNADGVSWPSTGPGSRRPPAPRSDGRGSMRASGRQAVHVPSDSIPRARARPLR